MITNVSRILAYQRCPRYYENLYLKNLVPLKRDMKDADFGTAIHKAMESWYEPISRKSYPSMDDDAAIDAFLEALPEEHDVDAKETVSSGYGIVLLKRYFDLYREQDGDWKIHGREIELTGKVGENTLHVRLDMIVETEGVGAGLWHVQHKTLSAFSNLDDYVRLQQLAFHERAYKIVAEQNGLKLKGTIVNIFRKLVIPTVTRQKDGVKFKTMMDDLSDWMPFHRERMVIGKHLIEEFKDSLTVVTDEIETCKALRYFPQHCGACVYYNKLCPYYYNCSGMPIEADEWGTREEDYVDREERG